MPKPYYDCAFCGEIMPLKDKPRHKCSGDVVARKLEAEEAIKNFSRGENERDRQ